MGRTTVALSLMRARIFEEQRAVVCCPHFSENLGGRAKVVSVTSLVDLFTDLSDILKIMCKQ
jgi:hypothetical protein